MKTVIAVLLCIIIILSILVIRKYESEGLIAFCVVLSIFSIAGLVITVASAIDKEVKK